MADDESEQELRKEMKGLQDDCDSKQQVIAGHEDVIKRLGNRCNYAEVRLAELKGIIAGKDAEIEALRKLVNNQEPV